MVMWLEGAFENVIEPFERKPRELFDPERLVTTAPFRVHKDKGKEEVNKASMLRTVETEDLVVFNQFFATLLALHKNDNINIRAILAEIVRFRELAEKASELNKVVQQLDGYDGQEIKISLGLNGYLNWPADELIGKVNSMMSDVVLDLRRQEVIIERMASAIGGEVDPVDHQFDLDLWLLQWEQDVKDFFEKAGHLFRSMRARNSLINLARNWNKEMAAGLAEFYDGHTWPESNPPSFDEALSLILTDRIYVRNVGDTIKDRLRVAREYISNEGENG